MTDTETKYLSLAGNFTCLRFVGLYVFKIQHPRQPRTEYSVLLRTTQLFLRKHFFQAPKSGHFKKAFQCFDKRKCIR